MTQQGQGQDQEYADEIWKIGKKEGKPTGFQYTNLKKLKDNKEKFPDYYEAIYGKDVDGQHTDGLWDLHDKFIRQQEGGEEKPRATIGTWTVGLNYFEDSDSYSVFRVPKRESRAGGGGRPYIPYSLVEIYEGTVKSCNEKLKLPVEDGQVWEFNSKQRMNIGDESVDSCIILLKKKMHE